MYLIRMNLKIVGSQESIIIFSVIKNSSLFYLYINSFFEKIFYDQKKDELCHTTPVSDV